ncbi:MAG: peptide ABC transporter substrate-binding protein [Caldilineaceae bacterium]|nr:peptide ABC transporter substrate-binding protein [Caldilineaceae bacterium]
MIRKNHKTLHLFIGLVATLAMLLSACTAAAPAGSGETASDGAADTAASGGEEAASSGAGIGDRDPKTLVILYWQAASLPGPYLSGGTKDQDAGAITLEPLANVAPDGTFVPKLATEIPTVENGGISEDLTTITWKLKEGVKWSDGSDFTADDVVFTWEYCTDPDTGCTQLSRFEGVTNVEAVDDYTVKVTFDKPTPFMYTAFVTVGSPIISRAQFGDCVGAAAQTCNEQNTLPLGTGPYKIVDFKVNDVATYERNENYHGEPAYFDKVVFKGGGDAVGAARAVLETGEADYAWNLQVEPDVLAEMESGGNGAIITHFGGNVERILVNQTNPDPDLGDLRSEYDNGENPHPFLTFKPIPQAMSMAIDRNLIAEQLYGFAGQATCNVIPAPDYYASTANDSCLTQDLEGAKALLDENDVVDSDGDGIREYNGVPLKVRYQTSTNSVRQKTQALIKQWWSEIGIDTELLNHDAGVYFGGDPNSNDTYQKFFTDVEMYTTGPSIDPQQHLSEWICDQMPSKENLWGGNNIFRGCNAEYDELYQQLTSTPIGPEREDIVKQLNDINVQNYYQIPLVHRGSVSATINGLEGVEMNGGWDTEMWNIAEWSRSE